MDETKDKREYRAFIELCVSQLAAAMQGARRESALLAEQLVDAANLVNRITPAAATDDESSAANPAAGLQRQLRDRVNGVVLRMQFADRLDQQVDNVRKNLLLLAASIDNGRNGEDPLPWPELLQRARESFTMEQERYMFDSAFGDARKAAMADRTRSYAVLFNTSDGDD